MLLLTDFFLLKDQSHQSVKNNDDHLEIKFKVLLRGLLHKKGKVSLYEVEFSVKTGFDGIYKLFLMQTYFVFSLLVFGSNQCMFMWIICLIVILW